MRLLTTPQRDHQPLHRSRRLWEVVNTLRELAAEMKQDGLGDEADGLETTIRDLDWQYEALLDKELLGEWPSGPRRSVRAPLRAVR